MIKYEWNEDKRLSNLARHGLDFRRAYLVYENPDKLTLKSRYSHELRLVDIAEGQGDGAGLYLAPRSRQMHFLPLCQAQGTENVR